MALYCHATFNTAYSTESAGCAHFLSVKALMHASLQTRPCLMHAQAGQCCLLLIPHGNSYWQQQSSCISKAVLSEAPTACMSSHIGFYGFYTNRFLCYPCCAAPYADAGPEQILCCPCCAALAVVQLCQPTCTACSVGWLCRHLRDLNK